MTYHEFFRRATGGLDPFPYQARLADADGLPCVIRAPTGAGKTAAVMLAWLWRRRFHPSSAVRASTPRRLVYCLPMRVLVEQTASAAREWVKALGVDDGAGDGGDGVAVHQLMGGDVAIDWDGCPECEAVLVGTQDQLLSRALNRGYSMSRYRWPVHYALLNSDCLWVMDEVQLMGPGLATSSQLHAFRQQLGTYGPTHSIWMSATLRYETLATIDSPGADSFRATSLLLSPQDLRHPQLSRRVAAAKPLGHLGLSLSRRTAPKYAEGLARDVLKVHRPGSLTLVVVNQVRRAQDVTIELRRLAGDTGVELVLVHSRFRRAERRVAEARLSEPLHGGGRIVVATQAVEAGVDLSARTLVTELAPWSSLVQRFGRCNRRGEWAAPDSAAVYWVDIETGKGQPAAHAAPYDPVALDAARDLLAGIADAAIQHIQGIDDPTPPEMGQVLRRRDVLELFDTTPDLAGEDIDVSPFIRDADRLDISVAWRDFGRDGALEAAVGPEELCPVGLPAFREFAERLRKRHVAAPRYWDALEARWQDADLASLRPGMTLLVDTAAGGYDELLGWRPEAARALEATTQPAAPAIAPEAYDEDEEQPASRFVALEVHLFDVAEEVRRLVGLVGKTDAATALLEAARWHDLGKTHPWFQEFLLTGLDADDPRRTGGPWAKSDRRRRRTADAARPHFRHELASALAMLQHGSEDLACYLAAAHHGKVRMSIRSLPGERTPADGGRFARGIWEGDVLPAVALNDGMSVPETRIALEVMELGQSASGPSWLERSLGLLERHGPFRLAFLEALLRIADWRVSERERGDGE